MIRYGILNQKTGYLVTHVEPLTTGNFRAYTNGKSIRAFSSEEEAEKYYSWNQLKRPYKVVKLKIEVIEE